MYDFVLINPWIYDFAAYDLWARPLGLLRLAGLLRQEGYRLALLDCLEPFHPELPRLPKRKLYGTGHYFRQKIPKPVLLSDVPRHFARYGLPTKIFLNELKKLGKPKAFLVTSQMTYWYPGVVEVVRLLKEVFPRVPIFLGGIYARLCPEHVSRLLPEVNLITESEEEKIVSHFKNQFSPSGEKAPHPFAAFDLQRRIPYVVIATSFGCPFSCKYCASKILQPAFRQRPPEEVIAEIEFWYRRYRVKDFAFYDDALLVNFENHLGLILEGLLQKGVKVRFHTPNALHVRLITRERARLLKRAGFKTLRLGFETVSSKRHRELDGKVEAEELKEAVEVLKEVGFSRQEIGIYLLWGLPCQDFSEVKASILFVGKLGATPYLAEYSPIPRTPLFETAKALSRYPLEEDPLFHNNSIFPCLKKPDWDLIEDLKRLARSFRKDLC